MENRFIIQTSELKNNSWVCTDRENMIMCVFENKKFNDTQDFKLLEDIAPDPNKLARYVNEMAEWLRENHYSKIF